MASAGHSSTQTPQSTQRSALITAFSSAMEIASLGQHSTHDSQPVQVPESTFAGITFPFKQIKTLDFLQNAVLYSIVRTLTTLFLKI
jgi:hypothetical protein